MKEERKEVEVLSTICKGCMVDKLVDKCKQKCMAMLVLSGMLHQHSVTLEAIEEEVVAQVG